MTESRSYEVAMVGEMKEIRTRHLLGLPGGPQEPLPTAEFVILEAQVDGAAMLFRFTAAGEECGDTWHESRSAAKEQAAWEYEGALGMWVAASTETPSLDEAVRYARRLHRSTFRA